MRFTGWRHSPLLPPALAAPTLALPQASCTPACGQPGLELTALEHAVECPYLSPTPGPLCPPLCPLPPPAEPLPALSRSLAASEGLPLSRRPPEVGLAKPCALPSSGPSMSRRSAMMAAKSGRASGSCTHASRPGRGGAVLQQRPRSGTPVGAPLPAAGWHARSHRASHTASAAPACAAPTCAQQRCMRST